MATNKRKDRWLTVAIVVVALALAAAVFAGCGAEPDEIERSLAMAVVHKRDTSASGYSSTDDVFKTRMPVTPFQTAGGDGTGEAYTLLETRYRLLMSLLQQTMSGQIVQIDGGGLNVGMLASPDGNFDYWLNGTKYTVAEDDTFAVTAAVDNHISVDATGVLEKTTAAWPGTDHWKLAIVTCDGSEVTAIKDCRMENLDPAAANGWYNIAAGADVDMAGYAIDDVEQIEFVTASALEIAAGSVTPTQHLHVIEAQTGTSDTLTDLVAVSGERKFVLIRPDSGDTITVNSTGNLTLQGNTAFTMSAITDYLMLLQDTDTTWTEIGRSAGIQDWTEDSVANAYMLWTLGQLSFQEQEETISTGLIDQWGSEGDRWSFIRVDTEADAASDDLTDIGGNIAGTVLWLRPENGSRVVTVKHDSGGGNIKLANSQDFIMADITHTLCLRYDGDDLKWYEVSRSHWITENLVGTGKNVPYAVQMASGTILSGTALSARVLENRIELPYAGTIEKVTGHSNTAPSGTDFYCDVKINGGSIFSNEGESVHIVAAANEGTSATKNHAFNAGDVMTFEVTTLSGADDVTIVPHILCDLQAAP